MNTNQEDRDQAAKRPNVLFVFADRMRFCDVGFMGNTTIRTPNLDRLASQGTVFEHAFSSLPICGPARATLLTGQYPVAHGVYANDVQLPDTATTMSETFAEAGYRTGFIGKWHLEWPPRRPGFVPMERRRGFELWAAHECDHNYHSGNYFRDDPEPVTYRKYAPKEETDGAIEFMRQHQEEPFFLMMGWGPPHMPIPKRPQTKEEYLRLYANMDIPLRENVSADTREEARAYLRHYYGMITVLDDQIGRLLESLDELDIADNTIVCFCSDHGDMIGSHGLFGLQLPWDECTRVPFAIEWPGHIAAGARPNVLLSLVDVMPTLLSLCGIDIPPCVQGTDLSGVAVGSDSEAPDSVVLGDVFPGHQRYGHEPWRGIRTRRWLYVRYPDRPWLLYDVERDPYQMRNLSDSADHEGVRTELEARLQDWLTELDDPFHDRAALEANLQASSSKVIDSVRMGFKKRGELHPGYLRLPLSPRLRGEISFY